ncbi:hypothetical protein OH76DRAFT_423193 [Lentinus brumalis]|uniref:Uncharacterized protein n=1 Tax=Lentinus brumalis TaxID=2498619 RepID=A0A371DWD6_9APHY|nr:hypothetical protein OH76DRAFT_423193 [Polyporus brumalis]
MAAVARPWQICAGQPHWPRRRNNPNNTLIGWDSSRWFGTPGRGDLSPWRLQSPRRCPRNISTSPRAFCPPTFSFAPFVLSLSKSSCTRLSLLLFSFFGVRRSPPRPLSSRVLTAMRDCRSPPLIGAS